MKNNLLFISVLLLLFGTFLSCDKHFAKKLGGMYSCAVDYHYMDITPTSIDSTFQETIEVKHDGKEVIVLGFRIHVDSLRDEKEYRVGQVHDHLTVQFIDKGIIATRYSGGLGGNVTLTYVGTKID